MEQTGQIRYKYLSRIDKKALTGKRDYHDQYFYKLLDTLTNNTLLVSGKDIKVEMSKGLKIVGLELTADNRLMVKDLASTKTVITPTSTKVAPTGKRVGQCTDFCKMMYLVYDELARYRSGRNVDTLKIYNCGFGKMDVTASKSRMLGGVVLSADGQRIVAVEKNGTLALIAEKWVYSGSHDGSLNNQYSIGDTADLVGASNIEVNGIEFVNSNISYLFSSSRYRSIRRKKIKIINSDMSHIKCLDYLCSDTHFESLDIIGTNLNNVTSMKAAFSGYTGTVSDEPPKINIPVVPNLKNIRGLFRSNAFESMPDISFLSQAQLTDVSEMFAYSGFKYIDLSSIDLRQCENTDGMFHNSSVEIVKLSNTKLRNLKTANEMFYNCRKIKSADLTCIDSPSLRMTQDEFMPYMSVKRTYKFFEGVNPNAQIKITKDFADILRSNL